MSVSGTKKFILEDHPYTLFPMNLSKFLYNNFAAELDTFCNKVKMEEKFLTQTPVSASKPNYGLRNTYKLDPVAEWYIYRIVYRNKDKFKPRSGSNKRYGYFFKEGKPILGKNSYQSFKKEFRDLTENYDYYIHFDIQSYFNNLYHHDIESFWRTKVDAQTYEEFSHFLSSITASRSIGNLPQGIYPSKMIGNMFLDFIDYYPGINSDRYIRFMDDFYLFDNDRSIIVKDYTQVQNLLRQKNLEVNTSKTIFPLEKTPLFECGTRKEILELRDKLLKNYDKSEDEEEIEIDLTEGQRDFLVSILENKVIPEEDAELILLLMEDDWYDDKFEKLVDISFEYPNLAKQAYDYFKAVEDNEIVSELMYNRLVNENNLTEYQLFWMAKMIEDFLLTTEYAGGIIHELYNHPSATLITKGKILEIQSTYYGLPELRNSVLNAQSNWLAWCSLFGMMSEDKASRNQKLKHLSKDSEMNSFLYNCIMKC